MRLGLAIISVLCLTTAVSCTDNDDTIESQRSAIVRYLTATHVPKLISEEDVKGSLEQNPPFYEVLDQNIYRYISTYYDEGRSAKPSVAAGDEVSITYTAYIFTGGVPRTESVYSSNDASVIAELVKEGLNSQYWSTEPLVVKLGTTSIIKGVAVSLEGCREGDSVEAYMTLDAGYKDEVVGIVPKESSILWILNIESVTKGSN